MAGTKPIDRKSVKQMSNDDYWAGFWNKKIFQRIFAKTPKFLKRAFRKSSDFFERRVPKLTKAGGDAMSVLGKNITYGIGCVEEALKSTSKDVERDLNDNTEISVNENAPVKEDKKKAEPLKSDGPQNKKQFKLEDDPIRFCVFLSIRLEHNMCSILDYIDDHKPALRQMLAEARNEGYIDNPTYNELSNFRRCRNKIVHGEPYEFDMKCRDKWTDAVFSLEKQN